MKKILLPLIVTMFFSCSKNYGYIYDLETKQPVKGVILEDINNSNNKISTDAEGKFSFNDSGDLIIKKDGYDVDTLKKFGCKPDGKCFNGHIFHMVKKKIRLLQ